MLKRGILVLAVLGMALSGTTGPVKAQKKDKWPDKCRYAKEVSPATYSGDLTPSDVDVFVLDRTDGASVHLSFQVRGERLMFTVLNKDVVMSYFNAGTPAEFQKHLNRPNHRDPYHNHALDYSLSSGFKKTIPTEGDSPRYQQMGAYPEELWNILAFNPRSQPTTIKDPASPFVGPIYTTSPGKISTKMYFSTDDPLCIRLQTPTLNTNAGSWNLTIKNKSPTATRTDISNKSTTKNEQNTSNNANDGDIQDSDGDGVINSEDYAPRDPSVQKKSDLRDSSGGATPGFGVSIAVIAILIVIIVASRRS